MKTAWMKADLIPAVLVVIFGLVVGFSLILPQWILFLLTIAMAKAFVVLGLVILQRTGLVSFGQALYYCLGAYCAGALSKFLAVSDVVVLMFTGGLASLVLAIILGFLLASYRGIFFGLLSMALSMILYGILVKSQSLGSSDGFNMLAPSLWGYKPQTQEATRFLLLAVACGWGVVLTLLVHRYLKTPLGRLCEPIRDNEIRVEYMGTSVRNAIHVKYVIAAALAGVGGALAGVTVGHIDPEMAYWTTSGEFVFIAILAGTGSVAAPFLGALIYQAIYSAAYDLSPNTWQMVVGSALLLVIVFLPNGLWSVFTRMKKV
ncbi:MAG: branched-chain amino acid ABC transporter permease [Burkholderiaceae bacterium]